MTRWHRQAGMSLVEILTALVIALFLGGVLVTVMIGSRTVFEQRQAIDNTGTDLSAAASYLETYLQQTGYREALTLDPPNTGANFNGLVGTGTNGNTWGMESDPDEDTWSVTTTTGNHVVFQYQAFEDTQDCGGASVAAGDYTTQRFAIEQISGSDYSALRCYGKSNNATIVEGLKSTSNFMFGEDQNDDGAVDTYVSAAGISAMDKVYAIRVTLVAAVDYTNADDGITAGGASGASATDASDYVYTVTIPLRNMLHRSRDF